MNIKIGDKIKYMNKIYELVDMKDGFLIFKNVRHRSIITFHSTNFGNHNIEIIK